MKIIIPGIPIPKARARVKMRSNKIWTFDPQESLKNYTKQQLQQQIANNSKHLGPISIKLTFFFNYPKDYFKWADPYHTERIDLDNLIKFITDCANKILFDDDKQIVEIYAKKLYSVQPRTEIEITPLHVVEMNKDVQKVLKIFDPDTLKEFVNHVQTLSRIYQEINPQYPRANTEKWLMAAASMLTTIAKAYTPKLTKLKSMGEIPFDNSLLESPPETYREVY